MKLSAAPILYALIPLAVAISGQVWAKPASLQKSHVSATTVASGTIPASSSVAVNPVPPQSVVITYDMSGLPLTLNVDKTGTAQVADLPFPGEVIYHPATGTVYYRHPEEDIWLSITPEQLAPITASATVVAKGAGQPWQGKASSLWDVKNATTTCDQWQASPELTTQTGLNVADILRILTTVQWLNGGSVPNVCEKIQVTAAEAAKIGLPILFTGPNGRWQLQEVAATSVPKIEIPKAEPITDEARLRLLLVQFSPEERQALLTKFAGLPAGGQVEAISQMLTSEMVP